MEILEIPRRRVEIEFCGDQRFGGLTEFKVKEVRLSMKKNVKKSVFVPAELYSKIEERAKATDFGSVDEYVEFVLGEAVKDEEETEKEVKKRLRDLGYPD